jgi:phosphoribosylpyrophosphate synthetase
VQDDRNLLVFTGNANRPLAEAVCKELGIRLGKAQVGRFSDGEVQVEIEENVRRQEVFVMQPTCAPSAENLVELLVRTLVMRDRIGGRARRACRSRQKSRPRCSPPSGPTGC